MVFGAIKRKITVTVDAATLEQAQALGVQNLELDGLADSRWTV
jgi:hypothetical protein